MPIHEITDIPTPEMQRALAVYESKFLYALPGERYFRIDYGSDRSAFVRSLGTGWCLLAAERDGQIAGTLEMALRELRDPGGECRPAVYYTEVRLLPEVRRGTVAARLLQRAAAWAKARAAQSFCIANEATATKPSDYSGRLGIPKQRELSKLAIIRIPVVPRPGPLPDSPFLAPEETGHAVYEKLSSGCWHFTPSGGKERSSLPPQWLVHPRGTACARLEDRRAVLRLVSPEGELRPAFLSCLAFSNAAHARELIGHAVAIAASLSCHALRFCAGPQELQSLRAAGWCPIPAAGAAIYGDTDLPASTGWIVNAAEI